MDSVSNHANHVQPEDIDRFELDDHFRGVFTKLVDRTDWEKGTRIIVAEDPSIPDLVGYVMAGFGCPQYFEKLDGSVKQLYLSCISVKPAYQHRGYGTALMEYLIQEAKR